MKLEKRALALIAAIGVALTASCSTALAQGMPPQVRMRTSLGDVVLELDAERAPVTSANFLTYTHLGFYDRTLFHRILPGFVIQGGGFNTGLAPKATRLPIVNEAGNGLSNVLGTIAMARTGVINSATSQFFINTKDNPGLDHRDNSTQGFGYAVFGRVIEGLDVVAAIEHVPTTTVGPYKDVPVNDVLILSAREVTACLADCDSSGDASNSELITLVSVGLESHTAPPCTVGDVDGSGTITIDEIVTATQQPCVSLITPRQARTGD